MNFSSGRGGFWLSCFCSPFPVLFIYLSLAIACDISTGNVQTHQKTAYDPLMAFSLTNHCGHCRTECTKIAHRQSLAFFPQTRVLQGIPQWESVLPVLIAQNLTEMKFEISATGVVINWGEFGEKFWWAALQSKCGARICPENLARNFAQFFAQFFAQTSAWVINIVAAISLWRISVLKLCRGAVNITAATAENRAILVCSAR